ncbi:MAG TPA: hypothetical protein VHY80_01575, partial [Stellaceae bacterium]|nr:hypothetical protein [Stellaceae bacterium]
RRYHPFTKIHGQRSGHQMLASIPASILNHKIDLTGIPSDSGEPGNALSGLVAARLLHFARNDDKGEDPD